MKLEWDHTKRLKNLADRKLDFRDVLGFDWSGALYAMDERKNYGEERIVATGFFKERLTVLVYTKRFDSIRIISWRRANQREIGRYENIH